MLRVGAMAVAAALGLSSAAAIGPPAAEAGVFIGVSVNFAPPLLPAYAQPPIPGPGYLWTPGYWAWAPGGYYWAPGVWALPPNPGLLWTPPWWGWSNGAYLFHTGYWGATVGFYGGVNYGWGYGGFGYGGGYWNHGQFFYNRTVNNVTNVNITNVYQQPVNVSHITNVSYNGGAGGTTAQPTATELAAAQAAHTPPTAAQIQHVQLAAQTPSLRASANHGMPPIAATSRPGVFSGAAVTPAQYAGRYDQPGGANALPNHQYGQAQAGHAPAAGPHPAQNRPPQPPHPRNEARNQKQ